MELPRILSITSVLLVVFCVIVRQSEASPIGEAIDHRYQADIDDFDKKVLIGGKGNIVITLGQHAIDTIEKLADQAVKDGANREAVDCLTDGMGITIKLIAKNGDDACDLLDKYYGSDKYIVDPEESIEDIERGLRVVKEAIFHSGVPILHALGASGVIAPGVSVQGLKEAMDPIQDSGTAIFEAVYAAEALATRAMKSAARSRDKSIFAAHSAMVAGTSALNSDFVRAAKKVFAYLVDVASGKIKEEDHSGDILSAGAKAVARDNETIAVIENIDSNLLQAVLEKLPSRILSRIRQGVLSDIKISATGIAEAFKAIEEARKLPDSEKEKALQIVKDGMNAARKGCIDGSVSGYQGFGAAAHLVGQKKVFSAAIEEIENSRIDSTRGIEAARKLANIGLIAEGESKEQGLNAAHATMEAVEIELYAKISNAALVALKVLKAVTKLPGLI